MVIYPLKMVIYPLKMVSYPLKMIIYPLKMVIYPLKIVIYPLKMIIYQLKMMIYHCKMVIFHSKLLNHPTVSQFFLWMKLKSIIISRFFYWDQGQCHVVTAIFTIGMTKNLIPAPLTFACFFSRPEFPWATVMRSSWAAPQADGGFYHLQIPSGNVKIAIEHGHL